MKYQAFISYKHASSGAFAERLEIAIKAYAKPIWQPPVNIFRDEKYLRPGANLPKMIKEALEDSEFLVYLASPEAALSPWVMDELTQWCAVPERAAKLIVVLTSGSIALTAEMKTIDWEKTDALPELLRKAMPEVPLFVDCTQFVAPERQSLLDPDFKKAVNAIVAAFRGIDPIELSGLEIIQYRKNIRNRNSLLGVTAVMLIIATIGGSVAFRQTQEASRQSHVSRSAQLASEASAAASAQLPQRALLLAAAAAEITKRQNEGITQQAEQSLRDLLSTIGGRGLDGHRGNITNLKFLQTRPELLSIDDQGVALLSSTTQNAQRPVRSELISGKGRILAMQLLEQERSVRFVTAHAEVMTRDLGPNPGNVTLSKLEEFTQDDECEVKTTGTAVLQISNRDGVLRTWSLAQTGIVKPLTRKIADNALSGCAISDDGRWVYAKPDRKPAVIARVDIAGTPSISLSGTTSEVVRVAFAPQSRQLALAMADGSTRLWNLGADGVKLGHSYRIPGNTGDNNLIAFSRSGRLLVAGGQSGGIRFWKVDAGEPAAAGRATVPFEFNRAVEGRFSFERDDGILIASDGLRAAAAIDLRRGPSAISVSVLHNHPSRDDVAGDRATPYAIHPDLPVLVTAGDDHNAQLWHFSEAAFVPRAIPLRGHDERIVALEFSADKKWLATASYDHTIRLWPLSPVQWLGAPAIVSANPADLVQNASVANPFGGARDARFLQGDEWFETTGDTPGVRLGRIDHSGRLTDAVSLESDEALAAYVAKDESQLNLLSSYRPFHRLLLQNLHARERLRPLSDDASFEMDPAGRILIEASEDGTILSWDLVDAASRPIVYRGLGKPIASLRVDSRFGLIAAVDERNQFAVWRIGAPSSPKLTADLTRVLPRSQSLDSSAPIPGGPSVPGSSPSLKFVSSGRWIAFDFKYLLDLDANGGPLAWRLPEGAHETRLLDCCVMQLFDEKFNLWSLDGKSDRPVRFTPKDGISRITAYDYSSAQRRLVLGQMNGRVVLIDFTDKGVAAETVNVASHDFAIRSLALNSDARMVAAGSRGEVTLTRLAGDNAIASHVRLKIHGGDVRVLSFSPNDKWLLSGGEDEAVYVQPVSPSLLLEIACRVAGRAMSANEAERTGLQAESVCRPS